LVKLELNKSIEARKLNKRTAATSRCYGPGGWLIAAGSGAGLTFYPDPGHEWDGTSLA
jgi:hypothetical protein